MAMKNGSKNGEKVARQKISCPHCGFMIDPDPEMSQSRQSSTSTTEASTGTIAEKRRHQRLELRSMVEVNGEKALLFNISRSGLMLSTPFHPRGSEVEVMLDNGEQHFSLKGVVRWVSKKRTFSNLVDFGVEIIDPPPAYQEFVERIRSTVHC